MRSLTSIVTGLTAGVSLHKQDFVGQHLVEEISRYVLITATVSRYSVSSFFIRASFAFFFTLALDLLFGSVFVFLQASDSDNLDHYLAAEAKP
jgi:hypothetical protein